MKLRLLAMLALAAAPLPAAAQTWQVYSYPDNGFAIQLPAMPEVSHGDFKLAGQAPAPAVIYALRQPDIVYTMTVADYSQTTLDEQTAIGDAVKALSAAGEVKLDVTERVNREFGRQLSILGKDGSRSTISVFFVDHRLYQLEGKALPPDPSSGSGKAIRFQQSLQFVGLGGEGRGPGGFGRRGPPAQAFAECNGKTAGDAVRHTTPDGVVAATCVQTPRGLAARPLGATPGAAPRD